MELIGEGGLWKVYKLEQGDILRIPKGLYGDFITKFIDNHQHILQLGLPTLDKVTYFDDGKKCGVLCDDVNRLQQVIYVTHNSLYSDSRKFVEYLSADIIQIPSKATCLAEDFRYRNKINEITNFQKFIDDVKKDLRLATSQKTLIEFDAYFFGTETGTLDSQICYKIVDLDHIYPNHEINKTELLGLNIAEFQRALSGFLKYFVNKKTQNKYLECMDM